MRRTAKLKRLDNFLSHLAEPASLFRALTALSPDFRRSPRRARPKLSQLTVLLQAIEVRKAFG